MNGSVLELFQALLVPETQNEAGRAILALLNRLARQVMPGDQEADREEIVSEVMGDLWDDCLLGDPLPESNTYLRTRLGWRARDGWRGTRRTVPEDDVTLQNHAPVDMTRAGGVPAAVVVSESLRQLRTLAEDAVARRIPRHREALRSTYSELLVLEPGELDFDDLLTRDGFDRAAEPEGWIAARGRQYQRHCRARKTLLITVDLWFEEERISADERLELKQLVARLARIAAPGGGQ